MNRTYRQRGMALAIALALASPATPAQAVLPSGVVSSTGSGQLDYSVPDTLTLTNTTPTSTIDWTSFSIGAGGTVNIVQSPTQALGSTVVGTGVSFLSGHWTGQGIVALRNDNSVSMDGSYLAPGGAFQLATTKSLGVTGSIGVHGAGSAHGGDVYLEADDYLEVSGHVDVGADQPANAGTLHVSTLGDMMVSDSFFSHILPDGTHDPAYQQSQVKTSTLNNAGGGIELVARGLSVYGDIQAAGALTFSATGPLVLASNVSTTGATGDATIALASASSIDTDGLVTPGAVYVNAPTIYMDRTTSADLVSFYSQGGQGIQAAAGVLPAIHANVLSGVTDADAWFNSADNQIKSVDDVTVGQRFYFANSTDVSLSRLRVTGDAGLNTGTHDIVATGGDVSFGGTLELNARDVTLSTDAPLTLGLVSARNATLQSTGAVRFTNQAGLSGSLSVTAAGDITGSVSGVTVAGDALLDAGTHDVDMDAYANSVGGVLSMRGANVTYKTNGVVTIGDVTATTSATLGGLDNLLFTHAIVVGDVAAPVITVFGAMTVGDGTRGSLTGNVQIGQSLDFNRSDRYAFGGDITGQGSVAQQGQGILALNGHEGNAGGLTAFQGTVLVGDAAHPGAVEEGPVTVFATLGGTGRVTGAVEVLAGGILAPGDGVGTLRVGSLAMDAYSTLAMDAGHPGADFTSYGTADSVHVDGDVTLGGPVSLKVTDAGGMGPGLYNVLTWGGTLDDSAGSLQVAPGWNGELTVQTSVADKRIDLLSTKGMVLAFWNANGLASGAVRGGGSGTWSNTSATWTDSVGTITRPMAPYPGYAIFAGTPGNVRVDASAGTVLTHGMQFAVDGYSVSGDPLLLDGSGDDGSYIRVGDGSAAGAAMTATINSRIDGQASLNKTDAGTLVLTAANTYAFGTYISGGVLEVAADSALGASSGLLTLNGGTLRIDGTSFQQTGRQLWIGAPGGGIDVSDAANTFTINTDNVVGTGNSLVKTGAGTLQLLGSQLGGGFRGPLVVAEGTVRGTALALAGNITNNATVVFDQSFPMNTLGSTSGSGVFVKQGTGILGLDGQSTFTGQTRVEQGGLEVGTFITQANGSPLAGVLGGDVSIAHGATLSGVGTLSGNVAVHGYIVPGYLMAFSAPGALRVGGNVAFASDSTLMISGEPGRVSQLNVGGHVSIDPGARLVVDAQASQWVANQKYDVLTAAGGVSGTFASINSNFAFLNTLVAYSDSGNISLILQRNAAALEDAATTPNQHAVAVAAGTLGAGHAVYDRLIVLDAATARTAFTSLAGTLHASTQGVVMDSQRQVRDAVSRHLADADELGGERADAGRVSTWVSVLGRDANYDGDANAAKVDASDTGVLLGVDLATGDSGRLGGVLGHATQNVHERSSSGSADVKTTVFGLYGDLALDALHLSGGVFGAHHAIDTRRDIVIGSGAVRGYASRDADTAQGFAELGYAFGAPARWKVEPFVQAALTHWSGDKATERGGIGTLAIEADDAHVTTARAGVHLGTALDAGARFALQATVAWQHAWGDTTPVDSMRFAEGGPSFLVSGAPLARSAGVLDAGLVVRLSPAAQLDASYVGEYAGKVSDHGGRLSLNMTF